MFFWFILILHWCKFGCCDVEYRHRPSYREDFFDQDRRKRNRDEMEHGRGKISVLIEINCSFLKIPKIGNVQSCILFEYLLYLQLLMCSLLAYFRFLQRQEDGQVSTLFLDIFWHRYLRSFRVQHYNFFMH